MIDASAVPWRGKASPAARFLAARQALSRDIAERLAARGITSTADLAFCFLSLEKVEAADGGGDGPMSVV